MYLCICVFFVLFLFLFFVLFLFLQNMGIPLPCGRMTTVLTSLEVEGSWLELGRRLGEFFVGND